MFIRVGVHNVNGSDSSVDVAQNLCATITFCAKEKMKRLQIVMAAITLSVVQSRKETQRNTMALD